MTETSDPIAKMVELAAGAETPDTGGLEAGGELKPRKRGRKAAAPEPEPISLPSELFLPVVAGVGSLLERKFGKEFHYTDEQQRQIAALLSPVVSKHTGAAIARYGEEFALVMYLLPDLFGRSIERRKRLQRESKTDK